MNRIVRHILYMLLASLALSIILYLVNRIVGTPIYQTVGTVFIYLLALMAVPLAIGGIPTLIIYISKKRIWDNFYTIIWVIWIIFAVLLSFQTILGGS